MLRFTRAHRLALTAVVATLLYLPALGRPALWEPDEGRYAEIAREMVVSGDYVTPRNDWVRYFEKPPLVYWATAAAMRVFGATEFAARLPAALASVGQVVITEALAEAMFGAAAGILAALALALSPLFFAFARFATPDPPLAFFITAAMAAFYAAARTGDLGSPPGRRLMMLAAAMLALGTLAKGPVALALGGAIPLLWLILEGRSREALRIPWRWCRIVYLAIAVPWFVIAGRRNPGLLEFFFVHEHLQRYLENTEHGWGPWFFVPIVAGGMWPWICFAPIGTIELGRTGLSAEAVRLRGAARFLLIWFGVIFIFFSIPRSKLGEYILPGVPPLAIIAGYRLLSIGALAARRARRAAVCFILANGALALGATVVLYAIRSRLGADLTADGIAAAIAMLAGAGAAYPFIRRSRGAIVTVAPIVAGVVIAMVALAKARSDAGPLASYRGLAHAIAPHLDPGCILASYRHDVQSLPFYTGTREALVDYRGELAPFGFSPDAHASFIASDAELRTIWGSHSCVVLIVNRKDIPGVAKSLDPPPSIIGCEGKKIALYNRTITHSAVSCLTGDRSPDAASGED